ncbi:MAG: hypothetical protein Tsb002_32530 [Wenzhouxiangellaceae bacterium]
MINADQAGANDLQQLFAAEFVQRRGEDALLAMLRDIREMSGGLTVREVQVDEPQRQVAVLQDSEQVWLKLDLQLAADRRIAGLSLAPWQPPLAATEQGMSEAQLIRRLHDKVDHLVQAKRFSGAVILARDGHAVYERAAGLARRDPQQPVTLDTPINLGSINKMFTAVAIAQLAAKGKLDYSDTVGDHLADYPQAQVRDEVTIHHLLTHTSGLGAYWNEAYAQNKDKLNKVADFAALFSEDAPRFTPGSEFHYSNNGPVILGLIIEQVSGLNYYEYMRRHVYQAAGMIHSDHYPKDHPQIAHGYIEDDAAWRNNLVQLGRIGSPAGGGYASARDLLRFATALFDGDLLTPDHRGKMLSGKVAMGPPGVHYGYGVGVHQEQGIVSIGHNGGAPGINAEFSHFPDLGYTLIVLANLDHAASPLARQVRQWLIHSQVADEYRAHSVN